LSILTIKEKIWSTYNNNENFKNELVGLFEKLYSAYKMDTNLRPRSFFRGDLFKKFVKVYDEFK